MIQYLKAYKPEIVTFNTGNIELSKCMITITKINVSLSICAGDYNDTKSSTVSFSSDKISTTTDKIAEYFKGLSWIKSVTVLGSVITLEVLLNRFKITSISGCFIKYIVNNNQSSISLKETIYNNPIEITKYTVDDTISIDLTANFHYQNIIEGVDYSYLNECKALPISSSTAINNFFLKPLATVGFINKEVKQIKVSLFDFVDPIFYITQVRMQPIGQQTKIVEATPVSSVSRNGIIDYIFNLPIDEEEVSEYWVGVKTVIGLKQLVFKVANNHYKPLQVNYLNELGGYSVFTFYKEILDSELGDTEQYNIYTDFIATTKVLNTKIKNTHHFIHYSSREEVEELRKLCLSKSIFYNDREIILDKMDIDDSSEGLQEVNIEWHYNTENI